MLRQHLLEALGVIRLLYYPGCLSASALQSLYKSFHSLIHGAEREASPDHTDRILLQRAVSKFFRFPRQYLSHRSVIRTDHSYDVAHDLIGVFVHELNAGPGTELFKHLGRVLGRTELQDYAVSAVRDGPLHKCLLLGQGLYVPCRHDSKADPRIFCRLLHSRHELDPAVVIAVFDDHIDLGRSRSACALPKHQDRHDDDHYDHKQDQGRERSISPHGAPPRPTVRARARGSSVL